MYTLAGQSLWTLSQRKWLIGLFELVPEGEQFTIVKAVGVMVRTQNVTNIAEINLARSSRSLTENRL